MKYPRDVAQAIMAAVSTDIEVELAIAVMEHSSMNSAHEGFAVLLEEVDELKAEIWKKENGRDFIKMRAEAVQVAAMAIRLINDVIDPALRN